MLTYLSQLKWQFLLLQKNNIITISFAVTVIYGVILFFLRDVGVIDQVLVAMVLNDPSVIGFFFIALAIYTEMKHGILPAIFVSSLNIHTFLITRTIAISIIGVICSLGMALLVKGLDIDLLNYTLGATGICLLSAFLGIMMLTTADEFLRFTMYSIFLFLAFVNIPMLDYLGAIDLGVARYFFPIQGSLDLIDHAVSGTEINFAYAYLSILLLVPLFYWLAYRLFSQRIVQR